MKNILQNNQLSLGLILVSGAIATFLGLRNGLLWTTEHAGWLVLVQTATFIFHFIVSYRCGPPSLGFVQMAQAVLLLLFNSGLILLSIDAASAFNLAASSNLALYHLLLLVNFPLFLILGFRLWHRAGKLSFQSNPYPLILVAGLFLFLVLISVSLVVYSFQHPTIDWQAPQTTLIEIIGLPFEFPQESQRLPGINLLYISLLSIVSSTSFLFLAGQFGVIMGLFTSKSVSGNPHYRPQRKKSAKSSGGLLGVQKAKLMKKEFSPKAEIEDLFPKAYYFTHPEIVKESLQTREEMLEKWEKRQQFFEQMYRDKETALCETCLRSPIIQQYENYRIPVCPNCSQSANLTNQITQVTAWLSEEKPPKNTKSARFIPVWNSGRIELPKHDFTDLEIRSLPRDKLDMAIGAFVDEYLELFPQEKLVIRANKSLPITENSRRLLLSINKKKHFIDD